ncbi:MAG: ABC transporter ATP-binding protein [Hyphomicrobiales bacterium]|nr:ABC transporter ATP-binding protein [Hyphomicrobiales bacterium]
MALVEIVDLRKTYHLGGQDIHALDGVSLQVEAGEFVAVMGPSGSGKSTFMNLVGCLDRPTAGTYRLDGEAISTLSADGLAAVRNRRIGFVFQQFHLIQEINAVANVELPMIYAGQPRSLRRGMAIAALSRVGLGDRLHHKPTELSGGQQQRVAIARALVNKPAILLADEPTGALDSRTSLDIMALFQTLHRDGVTVIVVTHEPDVAAFASRVIHFRDGRILKDSTHQPRDAAVALAQLEGEAA